MSKLKLGRVPLILISISFAAAGFLCTPRETLGAQKLVDTRRIESAAAERTAAQKHSAQLLQTAARRFGPRVASSIDDSGKLRSLARYSPPLSAPDRRDPEMVGRSFARAHRDLLDLDDAWAQNLDLVARDKSGPNTLLKFRQQWAGIPVFQSDLRIHVSPTGEVVELYFHIESLPVPTRPSTGNAYAAPEWALLRCTEGFDAELHNPDTRVLEPPRGAAHNTKLRVGSKSAEVVGAWVWFPVDGQLRLAWHFNAVPGDRDTFYECVVDAQNGTLLYRNSITDSDFGGLVFGTASPQPSPTPGVAPPIPNPPVIVSRSLLSFAGDPTASPTGWVGPDQETIGNNVIAREDRAGDNETTLGATAKSTDSNFSFDLQLGPGAPSPLNFTEAAITSLFYWCNMAHDYFYKLGFTEAAGNFQEDNLGKGGVAGDSLRADAQDGADLNSSAYLNNASMSTPGEGSKPRMTVYLWGNLGGPYVDADFDAEVLFHEYTHGVFRRLVSTGGTIQSGAMNEGNSDFFSLNYHTPAAASPDGSFPTGGYSTQNFARGVRTRPYSTDLSVNDLSYADFAHVNSAGFEVHADGEIWVEAMWEVRARLIKTLGYQEGSRRVAQLMIDALKRSPADPSYVDMRDALISADQADQSGTDIDLIWEAFARRGIGFMAVGGTGSTYTVLPSQDLPTPAGKVRFFDDCFFVGENIKVYVGDSNNPDQFLNLILETSGGDSETVTLLRSGALFQAILAPVTGEAPKKNDGRIQVAPGDTVRVTYHDADDGTRHALDVIAEAEIRSAYSTQQQPSPPDIVSPGETSLGMRGSGLSAAGYTLPFAFPFYKRLVNYIYYNENGLITIDTSTSSGSNSDAAFKMFQAIAPLWMDLRTNGTSVPNEGVYVARPTSDSIRFRWAAETLKRNASGVLIAGNPANFAVTLFQNGDILFEYGAGNTDIAPTVGLSRRVEAISQIYAGYSSSSPSLLKNLDHAQSILWSFPGNKDSTIIFPYLRSTSAQYTGYAVVNCTGQPVDVLFSAQTDTGQNPFPAYKANAISLTAGAQAAFTQGDVFPLFPLEWNGWAEATTTDSRLAAFFLTGDFAQTFLSGVPVAAQPSQDLTFTHIPSAGGAMTGTTVYLVNPSNTLTANLDLRWHDAGGSSNSYTTNFALRPRYRLAADVSTLFPNLPSGFQSGYLRITSDTPIAGVAQANAGGPTHMIAAQQPSTATTLYGAQFASGNSGSTVWVTDVNLANTSDSQRTISLQLLDNNGHFVQVPKPGINPVTVSLAPGGDLHMRGDDLFHLPDPVLSGAYYEGTLVAAADGGGIIGDITFSEGLTHRFSASLPMQPAGQTDAIFAQVAEGQAGGAKPYFTGIALFNPNPTDVSVQVQVFNHRGILAAQANLTLGPLGRKVKTLGELVPGLNQIGGYLRVSASGGPISSFAVYGDSALDFLVAIPPQFVGR